MSDERSSGCGIIGFLAIIALLIVGMFAAGWLYLVQTPSQTQIIIDKDKVKSDTNMAVEKGRELVDQATKNLENAAEEATEEPGDDEPVTEEADSPNAVSVESDDES